MRVCVRGGGGGASPLYNFKVEANIFISICSVINHQQAMCREKRTVFVFLSIF